MLKTTAIKMLAALEAQRIAENAKFGGKAPSDCDYRHACGLIAEQAGFKSRSEWIDILDGSAELIDC